MWLQDETWAWVGDMLEGLFSVKKHWGRFFEFSDFPIADVFWKILKNLTIYFDAWRWECRYFSVFLFPKSFCENVVSCMFQSSSSKVQAGHAHCLLRLNACKNCRACGFTAVEHLFRVKFNLWITMTVWVAMWEKKLAGNRGLHF